VFVLIVTKVFYNFLDLSITKVPNKTNVSDNTIVTKNKVAINIHIYRSNFVCFKNYFLCYIVDYCNVFLGSDMTPGNTLL
jgi:hypothetical protein